MVAEVLGNLALEENALETLADARRFLKEGGTLIPGRIEQFVAPVVSDRVLARAAQLGSRSTAHSISAPRARCRSTISTCAGSRATTCCPATDAARRWDEIDFREARRRMPPRHRRVADRGTGENLRLRALVVAANSCPASMLSTSPFSAPTHWDQVYAPDRGAGRSACRRYGRASRSSPRRAAASRGSACAGASSTCATGASSRAGRRTSDAAIG